MYVALVVSGVATNLLALASRGSIKLLGLDLGGGRPFDSWWLLAAVTYTLSGIVAGLLGALCWFHFRRRTERKFSAAADAIVIYIGIDDTDIVGSPGTNQLARAIVKALGPIGKKAIICRHQLFFDPRVPYTSGMARRRFNCPAATGFRARRSATLCAR